MPKQLPEWPILMPFQLNRKLYRIALAVALTLTQAQSLFAQKLTPVIPGANLDRLNIGHKKNEDTALKETGELTGTVLDERKEPLISAPLQLFKGPVLINEILTDIDGKYLFRNIPRGQYTLAVYYDRYKKDTSTVTIIAATRTTKNISMAPKKGRRWNEPFEPRYYQPLIDKSEPTKTIYTREDLNRLR